MRLEAVAKAMLGHQGQLGQLITAVAQGCLLPTKIADRLGAFEFQYDDIRSWIAARQDFAKDAMTVPELAGQLGIKQEVAYHVVRSGRIDSVIVAVGRKKQHLVDQVALRAFRECYVSGSQLAKMLDVSPKALAPLLAKKGICPVIGPTVDGCRQYFYQRIDVQEVLNARSTADLSDWC